MSQRIVSIREKVRCVCKRTRLGCRNAATQEDYLCDECRQDNGCVIVNQVLPDIAPHQAVSDA
jgi:hypothetical protein